MMMRVIYALIPVAAAAVYLFGWRVLAVVAVSCVAAFLTEWAMLPAKAGKISQAVWVTGALLGLSLPPSIPYWIAAVGAKHAVLTHMDQSMDYATLRAMLPPHVEPGYDGMEIRL